MGENDIFLGMETYIRIRNIVINKLISTTHMGRKYYGYKPKYEHYTVVLYENNKKVGEEIFFVYDNGKCSVHHLYWGSKMEYEYNRDGFVEHIDYFDAENTKLLMLRTGAKSGRDLVEEMYKRFHKEKSNAVSKIREWCDLKGIKHHFDAWF